MPIRFARWLLAGLAMAVVLASASVFAAPKNIVVMVADDLGLQLGCYGDPDVKTPNLDRLAADGTRFTRAYCTTASCSASRSVILTGRYNHATAHYGHEHGDGHFRTYDNVRTLPVRLKQAGYRTCSIGKYHVAPEAVYHFDEYANDGIEGGAHNPVGMAANAKRFIAADDSKPFFLYFCGLDAHRSGKGFANEHTLPGVTPVVYDPAKLTVPSWLPDRPEVRQELAEFYQAISRWDQGVGALISALKETGHYDDTLILCLSDNGPPFPGAKTTLYEPGARLPLVVRSPEQERRGVTTSAYVTWADLTPTILDFAGVKAEDSVARRQNKPADPPFHGRSFLGVLSQSQPEGWSRAFLSHTFHEIQMYYPMRVVLDGRYKYIFNIAHGLPYPFASDLYASPTWQGTLASGQKMYGKRTVEAYIHRPRHELYDLEADPDELHNLADKPEQAAKLAELQKLVRDWQAQTRDPWVSKWTYE